MNGIQVTRQIVAERLGTSIVLLTAYDDVQQMLHAFRAGAAAYCSKDIEAGKLMDVIRQVARGFFVVGDQVYDEAGLQQWLSRGVESAAAAAPGRRRRRPLPRFRRAKWRSCSSSRAG